MNGSGKPKPSRRAAEKSKEPTGRCREYGKG